jgi:hypothetical protein
MIEPLLCRKRPDEPCGTDGLFHNFRCYVSELAVEEDRFCGFCDGYRPFHHRLGCPEEMT